MKKLLFLVSVLAMISCATNSPNTENSSNERQVDHSAVRNSTTPRTSKPTKENSTDIPVAHNKEFLRNYMKETYRNLENAVKGLSPEQLNFKSSSETWSILECLEHIVESEPKLWAMAEPVLAQPATPERRSEIQITDDQVMTMILNREYKAKASAEMQPSGKYTNTQMALSQLESQRKVILKDIDQYTMEDLRNRIFEMPMGASDVYQFILFIPGHTARHTLQILEIKTHPDFPKN